MKASVLIQYLKQNGWHEIRQQGIHCILQHPHHPNLLSVPDLGEQLLNPEMINDITREAGLKGRVFKIRWSPAGMLQFIKNLMGLTR
jgi:predicted RNA binding protein YcfA (HicA-like mRNA interferase family)